MYDQDEGMCWQYKCNLYLFILLLQWYVWLDTVVSSVNTTLWANGLNLALTQMGKLCKTIYLNIIKILNCVSRTIFNASLRF